MHAHALRYSDVSYRDTYGYRKLDLALRNAAWNIETQFAFGGRGGGRGLYSWSEVAEDVELFAAVGAPVLDTPEANARVVKKAARFLGADLAGICYAHPNLIYSHKYDRQTMEHVPLELPEGCIHAIVMAVQMDYEAMRYSPDAIAGAATGLGYSRQAMLANLMAAFVRGLGYQAVPCGNDTALSIPLAIAAGLGELGRMGLLIAEKYGPRVRICKVFTDLPLAHDSYRPFGVKQFCTLCTRCASRCMSRAIPFGNPTLEGPSWSNHSGVMKWYIYPEKCFEYWGQNRMDCTTCVRVCPFNKPLGLHYDVVRYFIKRLPQLNRLWLWMDDLGGHWKPLRAREKRFWESL
jgi:reductive dehalogenase